MSEVKHTPGTAPDSFVEQAMADAKEACAASYSAGQNSMSFDYVRRSDGEAQEGDRDAALQELEAHLTRQAARCAQLEEALEKAVAEHGEDFELTWLPAARSALSAPKEQST